MKTIRVAFLAAATFAGQLNPALAQARGYDLVRTWTVERFFGEVGFMVRWELMAPIIEQHGIDDTKFHACLKTANAYPDTRQERLDRIVEECVAWAKEQQ